MDTVRMGVEISRWPIRKVARGFSNILELRARIAQFESGEPVWAEYYATDNPRVVESRLRVDDDPPLIEFSMILGDAAHNFRGALDSLVWELCHLDGQKPKEPKKVQFPIITDPKEWQKWEVILGSMPKVFRDRILAAQPFQDHGAPDHVSMLTYLSELNNQDKHRGMIKSETTTAGVGMNIAYDSKVHSIAPQAFVDQLKNEFLTPLPVPLVDGTPLTRLIAPVPIMLTETREVTPLEYSVEVLGQRFRLQELEKALMLTREYIGGICGTEMSPIPEA